MTRASCVHRFFISNMTRTKSKTAVVHAIASPRVTTQQAAIPRLLQSKHNNIRSPASRPAEHTHTRGREPGPAASGLSTHCEPSPRSQTRGLDAAKINSLRAPPLTCLGNFRRLIFPGSSGLLPIILAQLSSAEPAVRPIGGMHEYRDIAVRTPTAAPLQAPV
jgi:hypothetical protein